MSLPRSTYVTILSGVFAFALCPVGAVIGYLVPIGLKVEGPALLTAWCWATLAGASLGLGPVLVSTVREIGRMSARATHPWVNLDTPREARWSVLLGWLLAVAAFVGTVVLCWALVMLVAVATAGIGHGSG